MATILMTMIVHDCMPPLLSPKRTLRLGASEMQRRFWLTSAGATGAGAGGVVRSILVR